ncbi:MAG TPA: hypothetical protein ENJ09_13365 [Planctomycetes bacterium]|nr:hypothetical protein [Planctomycetota bacterium]
MSLSRSMFCKFSKATAALVLLAASASAHTDIVSPNGGEVLAPGSTFTVEWTILVQHNQTSWDLWYSTTGASGPWIPIATNLAPGSPAVGSIHSYAWTVPNTPSNDVYVRVRMNNPGPDYYGVSDAALAIGDAAQATLRNGTGINPVVFSSVTPPAIGTTWVTSVDHSGHPGATATYLLVYSAPATGPVLRAGELLVSGTKLFAESMASSGTVDLHSNTIPNDVSLVGAVGYAQAAIFGGAAELTNALDLTLGF